MILRMKRLGSKSAVPQLSGNVKELNVEVVDIIQPSTMCIVLQIKLQQEERHPSSPTMILKIYDRQYSPQLRKFKHSGPATAETEDQFIAFLRRGYEGLTAYTEIRAILMEHISGFPLHDIVKETPESDWASICNQ
ncbi:hypothetical protein D6C90_08524, partial [Aureobasidium pullulans]